MLMLHFLLLHMLLNILIFVRYFDSVTVTCLLIADEK